MTVPHLTPAVQASTAPAAFAAVRASGLRLSTARRLLLAGAVRLRPAAERRGARRRRRRRLGLSQPRGPRGPRPRAPRAPRPRPRPLPARRPPARVRPVRALRRRVAAAARRARRACAWPCSTRSATAPASPTSRSPGCARPARRRTTHADAHPRRAHARPSGRGRAAWPPPSSACTSSASACSSASSSRTTSASAPAAPSRPASASPPTRSGMRHAFDADHIAAIDNTTRKFMSEGQRPLSVGFFFSLGHSTVVFVLALLLLARRQGAGRARCEDDGSTLHSVTGLDRDGRLGHLPLRDRGAQPRRPGRASCASSATCAAASLRGPSSRTCCSRAGS